VNKNYYIQVSKVNGLKTISFKSIINNSILFYCTINRVSNNVTIKISETNNKIVIRDLKLFGRGIALAKNHAHKL
jgi:hypothetical protein